MAAVTDRDTQPELLLPAKSWREKAAEGAFSDANLDALSHLLDDFIHIPGTPVRFGLDGIVGFIPGIGDALGGLASTLIVFAAWVRGVPTITIARMVLNLGIETALGAVPVAGDVFDIVWQANRRNYKLLAGTIVRPRQHTFASWAIFACIALVVMGIALLPAALLAWLIVRLRHGLR